MRRQEDTEGIGSSWWWCSWPGYLVVVVGVALGPVACAGSSDPSSAPAEEPPPTTAASPTDTVEATTVEDEVEESNDSPAEEAESVDPAEEFIDIPYWDVHVLDGSFSLKIDREGCVASEPGVEVCDFETNIVFIGSLFGRATTYLQGTMTVESDGCSAADGTTGDLTTFRDTGTITTAWGDEVYIASIFGRCAATDGPAPPVFWRVTGGTGRFEDATGLMNSENAQFGDEENSVFVQSLSTGTVTVRADLWEDWLPAE